MSVTVPFRMDRVSNIITYWGGVIDSSDHPLWTGSAENERSQTGMKMSQWRKLIANAQNASSPYLVTGRQFQSKAGFARKDYTEYGPYAYRTGSYEELTGDIAAFVAATNDWTNPAYSASSASQGICDAAFLGFLKKIRSKQTSVQGLVSLGEAKETMRMILHPAQSFRRMLVTYIRRAKQHVKIKRAFRGRRNPGVKVPLYYKGEAREIARVLSNLWLEFSFGAQPLLSDIQGACEAIQKSDAKKRIVRISDFSNSDSVSMSYSLIGISPQIAVRVITEERLVEGCRYTGALDWKSEPRSTERLNELCGFQLRDFVPSVYELIPYSFVVDYFSTVGDVIGATFTATNNMLWWCRTRRRFKTTTWSVIGAEDTNPGTPGTCQASKSQAVRDIFNFQRDIPSLYDIPRITLRLPGLSTKWINLAALLAQAKL